jgi:hypothetical protein
VPLLLLGPPIILVHLPVNRDDRHLHALAMAFDFTVTWQFSQRENSFFSFQIKLHALRIYLKKLDF